MLLHDTRPPGVMGLEVWSSRAPMPSFSWGAPPLAAKSFVDLISHHTRAFRCEPRKPVTLRGMDKWTGLLGLA